MTTQDYIRCLRDEESCSRSVIGNQSHQKNSYGGWFGKQALSAFTSFTCKVIDPVGNDPKEAESAPSPLVRRKRHRDTSLESSGFGQNKLTRPDDVSCISQVSDSAVTTCNCISPPHTCTSSERLLLGQYLLMDCLEAMGSQMSILATENVVSRGRLQQVEAEAVSAKAWAVKCFNAPKKQIDAI